MAIVTMNSLSAELTPQEIMELKALESRPIVFDEDCPEMTKEKLRQFHTMEMAIIIKRVQHGSALEKQLASFIQNFSWNEVKEHLLWELENWNHEEWESFFVAVLDEKIVGMISVFKEDYYPLPEISPWVSSAFVSEDYRNRGICGQMIEYVNAYAKEQGFTKTYIPSIHTGLYEKYGYVYVKDITNYGGGTDRLYVRELK